MAPPPLHIVMFPWLAFGHLIPFFHFSKLLAERGNRVSFVSTPRNIARLPKIPTNLASLFVFVELQLPQVEHLPPLAESTNDLPLDKVPHLKIAFDALETPFANLLQILSPDWVIHDFSPYWLPPITAKLDIPCAFFSIFNAANLSFFGSPAAMFGPPTASADETRTEIKDFTVPPKWIPFPSNAAFRTFEIQRLFNISFEANESGVSDTFRAATVLQSCDIVAIRSCTEFEPEWLNLLQEKLYRKPVFPMGLLLPEVENVEDDEKWVEIKEWLDKQHTNSVVYVAFGSEASLSEKEARELAFGLELSGLPFFWVLRNLSGVLPTGFEERVKGRGIVWRSWVPQIRILSHNAIGGSLMHSGWSSVVESVAFGYPLILFPMVNDQALLARLLESKKVGLEIPRNDEDGFFTREIVAGTLKKVMVESEGEQYRSNAKELSKVFADKVRQGKYVDDFVQYLKEHSRR